MGLNRRARISGAVSYRSIGYSHRSISSLTSIRSVGAKHVRSCGIPMNYRHRNIFPLTPQHISRSFVIKFTTMFTSKISRPMAPTSTGKRSGKTSDVFWTIMLRSPWHRRHTESIFILIRRVLKTSAFQRLCGKNTLFQNRSVVVLMAK